MIFGLGGIEIALIIVFACLLIGILSGYPVAFALGGSAMVAFALIITLNGMGWLLTADGNPIIPIGQEWRTFTRTNGFIGSRIFSNIFGGANVDVLLAVPLFVFMGITLERSKIAEDLLTTMAGVFGSIPGGLAVSVVVVGALLAASTGIVGATVVTMGLLSLPTMLKRGYSPELATGTICASGTLGQIIPPSIVLVLLGQQVGEYYSEAHPGSVISVGTIFKSAIVPGLFLVALYIAYILIVAFLDPSKAPAVQDESKKESPAVAYFGSLRAFLSSLFGLPLLLVVLWILGAQTGLIGAQVPANGLSATEGFVAAPISHGIAAMLVLFGIIFALHFTLFPHKAGRKPLLIGLAGLVLSFVTALLFVDPKTAPALALLFYLVPIGMVLYASIKRISKLFEISSKITTEKAAQVMGQEA